MKNLLFTALCAGGLAGGAFAQEAAAGVSQAEFQALLERLAKVEAEAAAKPQVDVAALTSRLAELEAQNTAQAERIAALEDLNRKLADTANKTNEALVRQQDEMTAFREASRKEFEAVQAANRREFLAFREASEKSLADAKEETKRQIADATALKFDETTEKSESGRIFTTESGKQYYLADISARIFEPLSESGLQITPYGYLVFEGVHNTKGTESDYYTDMVRPKGHRGRGHQTSLSMQDSILGLQFDTPEAYNGWKFTGRAEFDLAGDHSNDYAFHWRHLYFEAQHESGWNILFGQTWHLWKMVSPSEIDGAWMEQTGHPYRRSPQFRVTKKFDFEDSELEIRAGIVKNGPGMGGDRDGDGNQDNSASAWGLMEGTVMYSRDVPWAEKGSGKRWMLGAAGMYGREKAHNGNDHDEEYDSKMVMFAGSVPFGDFTLMGQIFAGENLDGIQAGCYQGAYHKNNGHWGTVSTVGGFVDLNWELNETWSFAIGYGFDDPSDSDARRTEGVAFNERAYFDVFYRITPNFKLAFEYARLNTRYNGGVKNQSEDYESGTSSADRFHFAAFYDF